MAPIPDPVVAVWTVRVGVVALIALTTGCRGRSAESVRNEFDAFVGGANQCISASDCTTVYLDCPLGCLAAVRVDRQAEVLNKAHALVQEYQSGGQRCYYDCVSPGPAVCEQNRCAVSLDPAMPGAGGAGGAGSPLRTTQLVIEPADGTTAAAGQDITLRLYDTTGVVDDAKLNDLGARAFIETWPERVPVPFTVGTLAEPPINYKVIRLVPGGPLPVALDDRWYVAGVSALPDATTYGDTLADGTIGSRFRTGSHPRVSQIQFCEKEAPGMKLLVGFSEPITLTRSAAEIVALQVGGSPAACDSYQVVSDGLYFACAALTPNAKVIVSLGTGVQSPAGAAIEAASWSIDVGSLPAGSCRKYTTAI